MRAPPPADSSPAIPPPYLPSGRAGLKAWLIWAGVGPPAGALLGAAMAWAAGHAHGLISWAICTTLAMLTYGVDFGWVADWSHSRRRRLNEVWLAAALLVSFGVRWWLAPAFGSLAPWTLYRLGGWEAALWPGIGALLELTVILALSWGVVGAASRQPIQRKPTPMGTQGLGAGVVAGPGRSCTGTGRTDLPRHGVPAVAPACGRCGCFTGGGHLADAEDPRTVGATGPAGPLD